MLNCIRKLIEENKMVKISSELLDQEIEFISKSLELMRDAQQISNDAYLDSGSIQGGLTVISSLIEQQIPDVEIDSLMQKLYLRSEILEENHPGISEILESYRN